MQMETNIWGAINRFELKDILKKREKSIKQFLCRISVAFTYILQRIEKSDYIGLDNNFCKPGIQRIV